MSSVSLDEEFGIYLREMGLSEYESRLYLALLQHGTSTAKEVSTAADVPQSRVYDVLEDLAEKGFVTIQPGRPKKFGSVEPELAINQYTQYRRQQFQDELERAQHAGDRFVDSLGDESFRYRGNDEIDVFWSYKGKNYILEQFGAHSRNATDEIRMVTKANSFRRMVNEHKEVLRERHDQGVRIRIVTPTESLDPVVLDEARNWAEIRTDPLIEGRIYLFDDDRILIAFLSDTRDRFVAMSTESSQLYVTMTHLYDLLWEHAEQIDEA